jgi:hypothetical protein
MAGVKFMGLRRASLAAWAALVAVGVFASWPFFNRGLVGTGEAFNYSLSVADALTQMRQGVIPPLAGQSEYAFNGRIHPLRNAPYLYYLCAGIDLVTLHRLSFWDIQNVSLVLSLFGALFACYGGLRWAAGCPRTLAVFLASVYALGPPLMAAAHTFNLFMTVHAAVFVPLALAACVRGCRKPSFSNDAWLAAALAAAWLAHPPVAFWLTVSVIGVRLVSFAGNPRVDTLVSGVFAVALSLLLCGFVFVSAATLSADLGYFSDDPAVWGHFPDVIVKSLQGAFPGMLLPVSHGAGNLSDLQAGYVAVGLIGLSLFLALRRSRGEEPGESVRLAGIGCALSALVLVVMDLPVPYVTHWAWTHVLPGALKLTTEWPMQRLYLVAVGLSVFAAGLILPSQWRTLRAPRWAAPVAMLLGLAWVGYEARLFILRGVANRWILDTTRSQYRPENLDITVTSYAFVGIPPTYVHGVVDPRFEFRILRNGVDEIGSPLATALATAPVVQRGTLALAAPLAPGKLLESKPMHLLPGHRYLLSFDFKVPPVQSLLFLKGTLMDRVYALPQSGEIYAFGMRDGERRTIPVWTDSDKPEDVSVRVYLIEAAAAAGKPAVFANFTVQDVDPNSLPVRMDSLLPLRFTVDAPQGGCTVETPRRYLPGFRALVNGKPAEVLMSPYRQAMIPIPPGRSVVELSYPGPWQARAAFWVSASCWLLFLAWRLCGSPFPSRPSVVLAVPAGWALRHGWAVAAVALACAVTRHEVVKRAHEEAFLRAVGPMRVDFYLPYGRLNANDPLLATGKVGRGVIIFVCCLDATHIRLGADVWGSLYKSSPIEVDYSKMQTLVVSDGALFPDDNPRMKELGPGEADRLRSELRIELNGKVEIRETTQTYETTPDEVLVGRTHFGSLTTAEFLGRIVGSGRLPIPRLLMLSSSMHARIDVRFPTGRDGATEPLLAVAAGPNSAFLSVTYESAGNARLSLVAKDGRSLQSASVHYDPERLHELDVRPCGGIGGVPPLALSCTLDGRQVLGSAGMKPSGNVPVLQSGVNMEQVPGVLARFTGPVLSLSSVQEPGWAAPGPSWGIDVLLVTFPLNKKGRHEPILTSGVTGAGDFVYVSYEDEHHVRLGFDHWNGRAVVSDPISVDYNAPHEIWVSSGPLYPELPDNAAPSGLTPDELKRLRSGVRVALDGRTVITSDTPAYPSPPARVTIGVNRIGGSSADAAFSGIIHYSGRMNPLAVPW